MNDFIKHTPCEIFSFSAGRSLRGVQPKSTALDIHIHIVCYLRSPHGGLQPKSTALDIHIHIVCYFRSSHGGLQPKSTALGIHMHIVCFPSYLADDYARPS